MDPPDIEHRGGQLTDTEQAQRTVRLEVPVQILQSRGIHRADDHDVVPGAALVRTPAAAADKAVRVGSPGETLLVHGSQLPVVQNREPPDGIKGGEAEPFQPLVRVAADYGRNVKEHVAAGERRTPRLTVVGGFDASPWLAERGLGIAQVGRDAQQIAAFVSLEHLAANEGILAIAAGDPVAERQVEAARVDVRLHDRALAYGERRRRTRAGSDDRDGDLVPHDHRIGVQIAALQARVVPAQVDDLDVAEADPTRIDAHEQLARTRSGHVPAERPVVPAQIFQTSAV